MERISISVPTLETRANARELQSFTSLENVGLERRIGLWFEKLRGFSAITKSSGLMFHWKFCQWRIGESVRKYAWRGVRYAMFQDTPAKSADVDGRCCWQKWPSGFDQKHLRNIKICRCRSCHFCFSGNTVYIPIRELVKLSEEIADLRADERYEIANILQRNFWRVTLMRLKL